MKNQYVIFYIAAFVFLASCGKDDEGSVKINLAPNDALIVDAAVSTCIDWAEDSTDATPDSQSAAGPALKFPSFRLYWDGVTGQTLSLATVKILLAHENLTDGKYECTISGSELTALLAHEATALTLADFVAGPDGPFIDSNSATRNGTAYPRCGLVCGGVSIKDKSRSFQTQATIILTGYVTNADQTLSKISARTTGSVEW